MNSRNSVKVGDRNSSVGCTHSNFGISKVASFEVLEYPELGMEAVWRIEVENFPAFIIIDDKGNDFYAGME